jgi:maltose alpha-D-glucosyltransferase/alpha-amylase
MYVDLFAGGDGTFDAAVARLPHLAALGVTCVWLLPVLESPMLDAGFDISDYASCAPRSVARRRLSASSTPPTRAAFSCCSTSRSITARRRIAGLSTRALVRDDSPFRDFFVWSRDASEFARGARDFSRHRNVQLAAPRRHSGRFYFHRFFKHQPDLNYRSPAVLLVMASALLGWAVRGVDGFRLDAVPCLWKEGDCESRPQVHSIVKFFRAALDFVRPNTFLLAEACQLPRDVVRYFGDGDECHAAYHFPLMPAIFLALARQDGTPVFEQMRDLPPIAATGSRFCACTTS